MIQIFWHYVCEKNISKSTKKNVAQPHTIRPSHQQIFTLWLCQGEQYS